MRLSDFRAGPARTTSHWFFSAEFSKGYKVTPPDRRLTTADRSKLGGCRSFFRELASGKIGAERFPDQFGASALLPFPGLLNLPGHSRW